MSTSTFHGEIHPLADRWPMLPDDELAALADDIASRGQLEPISLDAEGRLIDGRNRLAACELATVTPTFTTLALAGDTEIAEYINARNAQRRNVSTGQKAMAVAEQLAAQGKRKNGRWQRGSVSATNVADDRDAWRKHMERAGLVLDYAPELTDQVIAGTITLNEAATMAEQLRDTELRKREAERQRKDQIKDLKSNRPDLAKLVDSGELDLDDALVIRDKETEAERAEQRHQEQLVAKFSGDVNFSIHCLAPLARYEERREQVRTGLQLDRGFPITAETIDDAIASLHLIRDTFKEQL